MRAHADTVCDRGACAIVSCRASYADCDQRADNGCEIDLTTVEHCGRCASACWFAHGIASCRNGQCMLAACQAGYGDCNGQSADGCELPLAPSVSGCPGAGMNRVDPQVTVACPAGGPCAISDCLAGFSDCNEDTQDGCEVDLASVGNCGSCAARCALPHVARTRCEPGNGDVGAQCVIDRSCETDELDCEITRRRGCDTGYADCDGVAETGCETDLRRLSNCGGCGISCVSQGATRECRDGQCVSTGCAAGYARCDGTLNCRSLNEDPNNCGACGHSCPGDTPLCSGGRCTGQQCSAQTADCDADPNNRCETSLTMTGHCGNCDVRCGALPHTLSVICENASCEIGSCETGFADCDLDAKNGCEVSLDTDGDCGGCGITCLLPQAVTRCQDRRCQVLGCAQGRGDCNAFAADGCENDLRSPEHCGRCGHDCGALPYVAAASCKSGACEASCQPGHADCDGDTDNGCETDLTLPSSCGGCQNDCTKLPNVALAECSSGVCTPVTCQPVFGDCNADAADGCERPLRSIDSCGACQRRCEPLRAQADCSAGVCNHSACDSGFGDCDGNAENGCESRLDGPNHCGSCATVCEAGAPCKNGKCGCVRDAQCGEGEQCCNNDCISTVGTCFPFPCIPGTARPDNSDNCGGCGEACLLFCCGPLF